MEYSYRDDLLDGKSPTNTPNLHSNEVNNDVFFISQNHGNKYKKGEKNHSTKVKTSISKAKFSTWSTLPKRMLHQLKYGENSIAMRNGSYNIENGALSIRRRKFPQLEVTIGSRTLERTSRGRETDSVVLEPLGKSDFADDSGGSNMFIIEF